MQTTITISLASLSWLCGFLLPLLVSISADIFGDLSAEGKTKEKIIENLKKKNKKTNIHHLVKTELRLSWIVCAQLRKARFIVSFENKPYFGKYKLHGAILITIHFATLI